MNQDAPTSKTQRKKQVAALQELGAELVALGAAQLAEIDLPEPLRDAVLDARRATKFEAKRRLLQYIGKLMRRVDAGPIRAALEAHRARAQGRTAVHKRIEAWRERLLADPGAVAELLAEYPDADADRLRALAEDARSELAGGRPPHGFRELFKALRALVEEKRES